MKHYYLTSAHLLCLWLLLQQADSINFLISLSTLQISQKQGTLGTSPMRFSSSCNLLSSSVYLVETVATKHLKVTSEMEKRDYAPLTAIKHLIYWSICHFFLFWLSKKMRIIQIRLWGIFWKTYLVSVEFLFHFPDPRTYSLKFCTGVF